MVLSLISFAQTGRSEAGLDSNHNKAKTVLVAVNGAAKTPAARVINHFAANAVSSVAAHLELTLGARRAESVSHRSNRQATTY